MSRAGPGSVRSGLQPYTHGNETSPPQADLQAAQREAEALRQEKLAARAGAAARPASRMRRWLGSKG